MEIGLEFTVPEVKQGSIVSALIKLDVSSAHEFPLQKLKSKTFAETIYVYDVGTPIRKEGKPYFESDAKIIFFKVPDSNPLSYNEEGINYKVFWNKIKIIPTEAEQSFLYGAFSVPNRFEPFKWLLLIVGVSLSSAAGFWVFKKIRIKSDGKKKLSEVKVKLLSATSYEEIVEVWMNRQTYLNTFPLIDEPFRKFEEKLFKVQFKPIQSEYEKSHVIESYKVFLNSIKGPLDGI